MARYEPKTTQTTTNVEEFIQSIGDSGQREDAATAIKILAKVSGEKPFIWGTSIVGFGTYHYKYASGHEGYTAKIGFAPRKGMLTFYLMPGMQVAQEYQELLAKLGKHKLGKGCLYIKKLSDVDLNVLQDIFKLSLKVLADTGYSQ